MKDTIRNSYLSIIIQGGSMFFSKKRSSETIQYNKETMIPVIKASICTGEQVAGFQDKETGRFMDICLIKSSDELDAFKARYGIKDELKKIY